MNKQIVAEITKNWCNGTAATPGLISHEFERIIAYNRERGFVLHSWKFRQLLIPGHAGALDTAIVETILAVFEEVDEKGVR